MLKAIILEDEEQSRQLLSGFLKDYFPQVHLVTAVDSVQAALEAINNFHPDVVFLDIELKGETSFDLLEKLQEINFDVIFITAYDSYTLKAIKLSAVDYLLKPINVVELKAAIEKAERKRDKNFIIQSIQALINNHKTSYPNHQIQLFSTDGFDFIKISNILYLEADNAYTHFYLKSGEKMISSKNIKEYEELLSDHNFFRIHKSYIVNKEEIKKYVRGEGGYVIMSDGKNLDVSRRRKDDFLKMLSKVLV